MGSRGGASGKSAGKSGGGGTMLNSAQKEALNGYMERMTSASKVKIERIKSLSRGDGIFSDDDNLKEQVGKQINVASASVDGFRYLTVPDKKGYADVEVSFKPIVTYQNVGARDLGTGKAKLKRKETSVPRQTLRLKVMNI